MRFSLIKPFVWNYNVCSFYHAGRKSPAQCALIQQVGRSGSLVLYNNTWVLCLFLSNNTGVRQWQQNPHTSVISLIKPSCIQHVIVPKFHNYYYYFKCLWSLPVRLIKINSFILAVEKRICHDLDFELSSPVLFCSFSLPVPSFVPLSVLPLPCKSVFSLSCLFVHLAPGSCIYVAVLCSSCKPSSLFSSVFTFSSQFLDFPLLILLKLTLCFNYCPCWGFCFWVFFCTNLTQYCEFCNCYNLDPAETPNFFLGLKLKKV